jgi:hypothetical protein
LRLLRVLIPSPVCDSTTYGLYTDAGGIRRTTRPSTRPPIRPSVRARFALDDAASDSLARSVATPRTEREDRAETDRDREGGVHGVA